MTVILRVDHQQRVNVKSANGPSVGVPGGVFCGLYGEYSGAFGFSMYTPVSHQVLSASSVFISLYSRVPPSIPTMQLGAMALLAAVTVGLAFENVLQRVRTSYRLATVDNFLREPLLPQTRPIPQHVFVFTDGSNELEATKARNQDWEFRIYNETTGRNFVAQRCPAHLKTYDHVVPIAFKADVFRLCALYTQAGLYMDDDLLPTLPLSKIAKAGDSGLLLVQDPPRQDYWGRATYNGTWQAFIGTDRVNHPFFECALATVTANVIDQDRVANTVNQPLSLTGPMAISGCAASYGHVMRQMSNDIIGTGHCEKIHAPTCLVMLIHKPFVPRAGRNRHYSDYKDFVA